MKLQQIETIPNRLLEIPATALYDILPQPTLLHLPGAESEPLLVSVLLHGNEHSGFEAVQRLLRKYQTHPMPRSISIFFGNTEAARYNKRVLDEQPDFNRVWPGTPLDSNLPEVKLMQQVVDEMKRRDVCASIDVHNNTGLNPHYGCVNVLEPAHLQLAAEFSQTVIYFNTPKGVQSKAMSELCPATTIECGKSGEEISVQHAFEFIDTVLHQNFGQPPAFRPDSINLFHTVARVVVRDDVDFGFTGQHTLVLDKCIDRLNFSECAIGIPLGKVNQSTTLPMAAFDEQGKDVSQRYLGLKDDHVVTLQKIMPAMLTLDEEIIRQDCLCYFMERIHLTDTKAGQYEVG